MESIVGVFKTKTGTELNKFLINSMLKNRKIVFNNGLVINQSTIDDNNEQSFEIIFDKTKVEEDVNV